MNLTAHFRKALEDVRTRTLTAAAEAARVEIDRAEERGRNSVLVAFGEVLLKALPPLIGVAVRPENEVVQNHVRSGKAEISGDGVGFGGVADPVASLLKSLAPETPAERLHTIAAQAGYADTLRHLKAVEPWEYADLLALCEDEWSLERVTKADRSHLVRSIITNRLGRRQVVWKRRAEADAPADRGVPLDEEGKPVSGADKPAPVEKTREQLAESRTVLANAVADPNRLNPEQVRKLADHIDSITKDEAKGLLRVLGQKVSGDQMAVADRLLRAIRAGREQGKGVGDAMQRAGGKTSGQYGAWGAAAGGGEKPVSREEFPKRGLTAEERRAAEAATGQKTNEKSGEHGPVVVPKSGHPLGDWERKHRDGGVIGPVLEGDTPKARRVTVEHSKGYSGKLAGKSWVAKINGVHPQLGFDRDFHDPDEIDWGDSQLYKKQKRSWQTHHDLGEGVYETVEHGERSYSIHAHARKNGKPITLHTKVTAEELTAGLKAAIRVGLSADDLPHVVAAIGPEAGDLAARVKAYSAAMDAKSEIDEAEQNEPEPAAAPTITPAEFDRRMSALDPRDSGNVDVPAKPRPPSTDDRDAERYDAAKDKLRRMEGWQADRPSVAADEAVGRARERVRGVVGEEGAAGEVARSAGEVNKPAGQNRKPVWASGGDGGKMRELTHPDDLDDAGFRDMVSKLAEATKTGELDGREIGRGEAQSLRTMYAREARKRGFKPDEPKQAAKLTQRSTQKPQVPATSAPADTKVDGKEPWEMSAREWQDARDEYRAYDSGGGVGRVGPQVSNRIKGRLMTQLDRGEKLRMGLNPRDPDTNMPRSVQHRDVIEHALAAGKPVPPEVLADYPDLAAKQPTGQRPDPFNTPDAQGRFPSRVDGVSYGDPEDRNADDRAARRHMRQADKHAAEADKIRDQIEALKAAEADRLKRVEERQRAAQQAVTDTAGRLGDAMGKEEEAKAKLAALRGEQPPPQPSPTGQRQNWQTLRRQAADNAATATAAMNQPHDGSGLPDQPMYASLSPDQRAEFDRRHREAKTKQDARGVAIRAGNIAAGNESARRSDAAKAANTPPQSPATAVDKPTTVGNTTPVQPQSAGASQGGGEMDATTTWQAAYDVYFQKHKGSGLIDSASHENAILDTIKSGHDVPDEAVGDGYDLKKQVAAVRAKVSLAKEYGGDYAKRLGELAKGVGKIHQVVRDHGGGKLTVVRKQLSGGGFDEHKKGDILDTADGPKIVSSAGKPYRSTADGQTVGYQQDISVRDPKKAEIDAAKRAVAAKRAYTMSPSDPQYTATVHTALRRAGDTA